MVDLNTKRLRNVHRMIRIYTTAASVSLNRVSEFVSQAQFCICPLGYQYIRAPLATAIDRFMSILDDICDINIKF